MNILALILALIVFGIIITVVVFFHELGHFLAARKTGTRVDEFAVGFPPFIYKKKKDKTTFAIGIIPFGGYNAIYGMDTEAKEGDSDSYNSKTVGQKMLIVISGVVGNLLLTILLFYIFLMCTGFTTYLGLVIPNYEFPLGEQRDYLMVTVAEEGSPAQIAGVESNDIILSINGLPINEIEDLTNIVEDTNGEEISMLVKERQTGNEKMIVIDNNQEKIGVGCTEIAQLSYNNTKALSGIEHAYNFTDYSFSALGYIIGQSFVKHDASIAASAVAGPVGLFAVVKSTMDQGLLNMINITAIISLALAITNILPLPALDGGKCIYLFLQKINPKVFTDDLSNNIDKVGFIFLIVLGILIVIKDVFQFKDLIL
jgi:regulator of sigma E protease